ncbi:MAG: hypothetical protein C0404_07960 [Verrucomicrobia bacterium]|nr:hypothetical protein [Verrucomicrobiota bacterium]
MMRMPVGSMAVAGFGAMAGMLGMMLAGSAGGARAGQAATDKMAVSPVTAKAAHQDPAVDQKYDISMLVWTFLAGSPGNVSSGPAGQAEDVQSGVGVDNSGNYYWTTYAAPFLRRYSKDRNWVSTVAGSARGYLDGPLERARFSGAGYNQSNLIAVSADGKHIFFVDRTMWRHVDCDSGMMSTVGEFPKKDGKGILFILRDKSGDIFALCTDGTEPPDCKGYRKLNAAAWDKPGWQAFDGVALDAEKMLFYYHCRGAPQVVDLRTGRTTGITSGGEKRKEKTGSLKGASFWCSSGLSISAKGRYLFMGGGDDQFCWRLDLEGDKALIIGRNARGDDLMFREQGADFSPWRTTSTAWPANPIFEVDGLGGVWPTQEGLFRLAPVK